MTDKEILTQRIFDVLKEGEWLYIFHFCKRMGIRYRQREYYHIFLRLWELVDAGILRFRSLPIGPIASAYHFSRVEGW